MNAPEMSLFHRHSRRMRIIMLVFAGIGVILCAANRPAGFGFLAGEALAVFIYEWNVRYWNRVLDSRNAGKLTGFPHFLINFTLMGALLLASVKYPEAMNIFAAAAGLTTVKAAIIIAELLKRKEAVK